MDQQPIDNGFAQLLEDLNSKDARRRKEAAKKVRDQKIADERIVENLNFLAAKDENKGARNAAKAALVALGMTPPPLDPVLAQKQRDFWLGIGLFYAMNFVMWLIGVLIWAVIGGLSLTGTLADIVTGIIGFVPFVINLGVIIFLAFKRPRMAFGMLAAFGVPLAITVCLALAFGAVCFVLLGGNIGG
jgi:hypothetical protein